MIKKLEEKPTLVRICALLMFVGLWQWIGFRSASLSFPTFTNTVNAWWDLMTSGELPMAIAMSISAMLIGLLVAIVVGCTLGLLMGWFHILEDALEPYMQILLVVPMMALVPIIVVLFGFTIAARATVVFLFAVVIIALNVLTGVRTVDRSLIDMGHSFGITKSQLFRKILLPGAAPSIIAGIRLGIGRAFVGMVAAEMLIVSAGFGNLLVEYKGVFKPHYVFAIVLTIIILSIIVTSLAKVIEAQLLKWDWQQSTAK